MEQQQLDDPTKQLAYNIVVGTIARESYEISLNSLRQAGILPANLNKAPKENSNQLSFEDLLQQYTGMYAGIQNSINPYGEIEIEMIDSHIKELGGLEVFLSMPEDKIRKNLEEATISTIKSVYSRGKDEQELTSRQAAENYVTGGYSVVQTLKGIEEILSSRKEISSKQVNETMETFNLIARADMYARALRAEQVFGEKIIGEGGELQLGEYQPFKLHQNDENSYDRAA